MVACPLWYNFPDDPNTYQIDQQFMLGRALLISPVLEAGVGEFPAYFPKGRWFSLREDFDYGNETVGSGTWQNISAPNSTMIPIHIAGGTIIAGQLPGNNTEFSRKNPFHLLVAVNQGKTSMSSGTLYWDDGVPVEIRE
jgi:alpha-glucosidase